MISRNTLSLLFNSGCAAGNAYQAPNFFTLSFAVGTIIGLGNGLKNRLSLVRVELNAKVVQPLTAPVKAKIIESKIGNLANRIATLVYPIFRVILFVTGYLKIYDTVASLTGNFDEQKAALKQKLNPIPGKILSFLSLATVIVNFGYSDHRLLSKIAFLSGYPAGYATGTFVMQNVSLGPLESQSISDAVTNLFQRWQTAIVSTWMV